MSQSFSKLENKCIREQKLKNRAPSSVCTPYRTMSAIFLELLRIQGSCINLRNKLFLVATTYEKGQITWQTDANLCFVINKKK